MKNTLRRTLGFVGAAMMASQLIGAPATGSLPAAPSSAAFEQAAPLTPAQKEVDNLLRRISSSAVLVGTHADRLESFTHGSRMQYQTHANEWNRVKDAVNAMGADFRALQDLRNSALPWQQVVIDRLQPVVTGLAGHTTEAIQRLNTDRRGMPPSAEYRDAVRSLVAYSGYARNVISVNLDYAQARERLNRLDAAPLAPVTSASAVRPEPVKPAKSLEDRVRSELLKLPYYGVFDHLVFQLEGGRVILGGDVTRPVLKDDAARAVSRIEGVTGVENAVKVLPLSPNDDRIRIAAYWSIYGHSALSLYSLNPQPPIRIIVENGNVTLKGIVRNEMDRSIAYMQASKVPGTFSVDNKLQIGS